ncbi:MAG: LysR family transcriptional regulator [Archangium sp.]|nr:LysR family transcriptional regulator [Archangium sp.]MDP3152174.1 LysR family transcriptional regulator [Archangium sp.]
MISPSDMVLYAAVVRAGSFTRAAQSLGITKQTASERITKLEERLGARLLERTTRKLRVTETGAVYAQRCAAIAAQVEEANAEAQKHQAQPVGLLRISAPVLYGRKYLMPVVAAYLARYPKVRVELLLSDRRVNFTEDAVDLAIRVGPLDDSTLTARKLSDTHLHCVVSPAFLSRQGTPTLKTLAAARCVGVRPRETWSFGKAQVKIEPVLVVNDLELAFEAALAGVGIARLPELLSRDAVRARKLKVLFGPVSTRSVYVVYPSRQFLPVKVRSFIEALDPLTSQRR